MILVILLTCDVPRFLRIRISTGLRWIGHDQKCFRFEVVRGNTVTILTNLAIFIWHRMISLAGGNFDVFLQVLGCGPESEASSNLSAKAEAPGYISVFFLFLYLYFTFDIFHCYIPRLYLTQCILRLDGNLPLSPLLAGVSGLWRGGGDIF